MGEKDKTFPTLDPLGPPHLWNPSLIGDQYHTRIISYVLVYIPHRYHVSFADWELEICQGGLSYAVHYREIYSGSSLDIMWTPGQQLRMQPSYSVWCKQWTGLTVSSKCGRSSASGRTNQHSAYKTYYPRHIKGLNLRETSKPRVPRLSFSLDLAQ